MSPLRMLTIGELEKRGEATLQTGPFGTQLKASEYTTEGTPVINVRNVGFGDLRKDDLEYLPEGKAAKLWQHHLKAGDIVFGRKGAVERHALIDADSNGWIQGSDCLRLRLNSKTVSEKYLSYYLRTAAHQSWMQALCSFGATMSSLNQDILRRLTFPAPPLATQQKIAAILSTYDDLIANNQRRITLLERMAEDIYREWFVRLRFPGHENVKIEKGVPQGWGFVALSEVASINATSLKKSSETDRIQYIDISAVTTNHIGDLSEIALADAPGRARRLVKHGDVIWSSVRPANRAYCLIYEPPKNLVASTGFAVISPKPDIPFTFINFAVTSDSFVDQMAMVAKGAAYPATSFDDFGKALVLQPSAELLARFHAQCEPMFKRRHQLRRTNAELAQQRDALLPRLISGKLSVDALDIRFPPGMVTAGA